MACDAPLVHQTATPPLVLQSDARRASLPLRCSGDSADDADAPAGVVELMTQLERLGHDDIAERELFLLDAVGLDDAIASMPTIRYFACLVAWDATAASEADIARLAQRLLMSGCVYILCWGPDCERVHDVFDAEEARVRPEGPFSISTWHDSQTLDDVLWEALFTAHPDDAYWDDCRSTVCIVIAQSLWATQARDAFADPEAFSARHLSEEDEQR